MQNRIWQEQCAATRQVRRRYGTTAAFDYLVGQGNRMKKLAGDKLGEG